jgi:hypothetical protein
MKGTNRRALLKLAWVGIVAVLSITCPDIEANEPAPSTLATKVDASRERPRLDEVNLLVVAVNAEKFKNTVEVEEHKEENSTE